MGKCRLTEKKMANKQYYKTERAIFIAYCKFRDYPHANKIAKHAQISRSTLHRHHQNANSILQDYEEYLFRIFSRNIQRYLNRTHPKLQIIYLRVLLFISNNKTLFKELFDENHKEIIKKMLNQIKTSIFNEWRLGDNPDKMFIIYANEILGVIEIWSEQNFSVQYLEQTLSNIMHLTKNARHSLLSLQ